MSRIELLRAADRRAAPWKNGGGAEIMDFRAGRNFGGRNDSIYPFTIDKDSGRPDSFRSDHSS